MSVKDFNTNTNNDETWLTPPSIIEALGEFDLDPCCPPNMPWRTAKKMISLPTDGLTEKWEGRVFLNPPYGRKTFDWLDKLAETKSGIALIFARTETIGFHRSVWSKAHSVSFFKGRLKFHKECGKEANSANAPSCLVSYSEQDTQAIEIAVERGKLDVVCLRLRKD